MVGVRRARPTPAQRLVIAAAVIPALAFPAWLLGGAHLRQRSAALERAGESQVAGPPCPTVSEAQFQVRRLKAPKATVYEGVTFARQFGHMDCSALRYGGGWGAAVYPACQFTSPNVLVVTTPKGVWRFAPGPGQPATVTIPRGEAHCVMAANFTMESLLGR